MRFVSTMALGVALALGGSAFVAVQPALAKKAEKEAQPNLSKPVREALGPAQTALAAGDIATADAKLAIAAAAATTPDDKYYTSVIQLQIAQKTNDEARQKTAIDAMIASGGAPASMLPALYQNQGALAYKTKNYPLAEQAFGRLAELSPANSENLISLAEIQNLNKHPVEAVATAEKAIAAKKAAGEPVPDAWYARALAMAYDGKMVEPSIRLGKAYAQAMPTPDNWRSALRIFSELTKLDDQQQLDVMRLQRAAKALKGEADFYEYANTAYDRGLPGEAKAVIDEGIATKMLSGTNKAIAEVRTLANGKVAADRGSLPASATRARSAADGKPAFSTANAFLGYGDYAQAIELYRLALQKGGIDVDAANTRLGIALALSGQKDAAATAFAAVTTGPRGQIAQYWTIWVRQQA